MTQSAYPTAVLDRRLSAYAVDRLVVWSVAAGIGYAASQLAFAPGRAWAGILVTLGVVVLLALYLLLTRTWAGRAIRSASENPEGAQLVGVDIPAVAPCNREL